MAKQQTPYGMLLRKRRMEAGLSLRYVAEAIGVSHVYLADVERGARAPLDEDREPKLRKIIKSLTPAELKAARLLSKPIKITMESTPEPWTAVTVALARRYEQGDSNDDEQDAQDAERILNILRGSGKEPK